MNLESVFKPARSFDQAMDILASEVTALGFDAVDYAYLPRVHSPGGVWVSPYIVARNFPPRWRRGWLRFGSHDPYFRSCYRRNLPLDWSEVKGAPWLTDMQKQSIAYIEDMGFPDGITVPIHLAGGRFAFVSAVSSRLGAEWRRDQLRRQERVFVLAHAFHQFSANAFGQPSSAPARALSTREIECLNHAAAGNMAPATAIAIERSVETVRRHLKSAMAKLGARTIAQAVATAALMGLLDLDRR